MRNLKPITPFLLIAWMISGIVFLHIYGNKVFFNDVVESENQVFFQDADFNIPLSEDHMQFKRSTPFPVSNDQLEMAITDISDYLKEFSNKLIIITGYFGKNEKSQESVDLGIQRANSIKKQITKKGITSDRIFLNSTIRSNQWVFGHISNAITIKTMDKSELSNSLSSEKDILEETNDEYFLPQTRLIYLPDHTSRFDQLEALNLYIEELNGHCQKDKQFVVFMKRFDSEIEKNDQDKMLEKRLLKYLDLKLVAPSVSTDYQAITSVELNELLNRQADNTSTLFELGIKRLKIN